MPRSAAAKNQGWKHGIAHDRSRWSPAIKYPAGGTGVRASNTSILAPHDATCVKTPNRTSCSRHKINPMVQACLALFVTIFIELCAAAGRLANEMAGVAARIALFPSRTGLVASSSQVERRGDPYQLVKKIQRRLCLPAFLALAVGGSIANAEVPTADLNNDLIPVPSPSFDKIASNYVIGNHTYQIPRNYIRFFEKDESLVSMDALLPDMTGLSRENALCFGNALTRCSSDVMTISLDRGEVTPFFQQIANIRAISRPDAKWVCGFEYYEDRSRKINHNGFRWLFKDFEDGIGGVILRCPDEGSTVTGACRAYENTGDGNSLHYIFHRDKMCNWNEVRAKARSLVESFKLK